MMAVNESDRLELFQRLGRVLGKKQAETFMTMVAHVPWSEVATKRDLVELRAELNDAMHRALRGQIYIFGLLITLLNGTLVAALTFL